QAPGGTITAGGDATLKAAKDGAAANIALGNDGNDFQAVVNADGKNVTIKDDSGGIDLGTIKSSETLNIDSEGGDITQAPGGTITAGGDATLKAAKDGAAANIALGNDGNDFQAVVNADGKNVTIKDDSGGIELGTIKSSEKLSIDSEGGDITQAPGGTISAGGDATLKAAKDGAPANIDLGNDGNDFKAVVNADGKNVTIKDNSGGIDLGTIKSSETLHIDSEGGDITQASGGTITAGGDATLTAAKDGAPANIALGNDGNDFQAVVNADGKNVTIKDDSGGIDLGTIKSSETLNIDSEGGDITQAPGGTITAGGDATLKAAKDGAAANIALGNDGNDFQAVVNADGKNVTIKDDSGGIDLGTIKSSETLHIDSEGGDITQASGGTITAGGDATLTAAKDGAPANIALGNDGNDFQAVVNADGKNVTIKDDSGGIDLGTIKSSETLNIDSEDGDITQASGGTITTGGDATLTAAKDGAPANIALGNDGNDFQAVVNAAGKNIALVDKNGIELGDITASGALAITADSDITQATGAIISASGTSSLTSTGGNVTLFNQNNDFKNTLNIDGGDVAINDVNSINLNNVTTSGNLALLAAGDITQAGDTSITASGASTLASTGGNIALSNSDNTFGGLVSVAAKNITLAAAGDLSIGSATASGNLSTTASKNLNLDNVTVGGNLAATSLHGNVFMTNSVVVAGSNTIEAPDGTISGFITTLVMSIFRPSVTVEIAEPASVSSPASIVADQTTTTVSSPQSVVNAVSTSAVVAPSTSEVASTPAAPVADQGNADGTSRSVTIVSQNGLAQNLDVTSSGGVTTLSIGKNASTSGGSAVPSDGSVLVSGDSSPSSVKSQMTVFVVKKGEAPTESTGLLVEQSNQHISLKTFAAADQSPATSDSGAVIGKVTFKLETKDGQELVLTAVVTEGGMSLLCEKGNLEEATGGHVDILVGTALVEVQKQLNISSTRIRTVIIAY
ncbi:MAG: hypothetical protein J0665_18870, partial [Deltaproteobacteria bacterium]|nr:hypothetical protein [Deltaproteobacteria bacterium]